MDKLTDLEKTYGPAAPYSEHKRGDHITYTTAEGTQASGVIEWVQAPVENIGVKYIVILDEPSGFLDFVVPADVIAVIQGESQ